MIMLAEYGTKSLAEVLAPAMEMADGYPMEADAVRRIRSDRGLIQEWKYSREVYFTHPEDEENPGPRVGEIFRQPDLLATLKKLVEAEAEALADGKSRKEAIYAAYDRFYRGDIAEEIGQGNPGRGRPLHHGGPGRLAGPHRGARLHQLQGNRCLQADVLGPGPRDAPGPEHAGGCGSEGDGVQQRPVPAHALSGHEPGLRRPGLLLRRPLLPTRGAHGRPPLQGVRPEPVR